MTEKNFKECQRNKKDSKAVSIRKPKLVWNFSISFRNVYVYLKLQKTSRITLAGIGTVHICTLGYRSGLYRKIINSTCEIVEIYLCKTNPGKLVRSGTSDDGTHCDASVYYIYRNVVVPIGSAGHAHNRAGQHAH